MPKTHLKPKASGSTCQASTQPNSSVLSRNQLVDLNEKVIIEKLDTHKTYYNSILSDLKPKFRYRQRSHQAREEIEADSYRDASSVEFNSQIESMRNLGRSCSGRNQVASKRRGPKNLNKRQIQSLVQQYFGEKAPSGQEAQKSLSSAFFH